MTPAACLLLSAVGLVLAGCSPLATPPPTRLPSLTVDITADGRTQTFVMAAGLTVREALAQAGIAVGELDRLSPPAYSLIDDGTAIHVTRVTETFETEQVVLPFASDIVRYEGLPEGERRLQQAGVSGMEEITYRIVFEDGVQKERSIIKRDVITPPVNEIILVGSQSSFTIVPITGTLGYLSGQNAWIMRRNSGQRIPVTTSGDLDGFVFDLSPDGQWLLYTRADTDVNSPVFNTLWAVPLSGTLTTTLPLNLQISNTLYAEWSPIQPRTFAYSTADKITRAPGWQANNDLWLTAWEEDRRTRKPQFTTIQLLDSSSGGLYGWWGTGFAFSPNGSAIAYARTDSIGVIDLATLAPIELVQFTAFNSHSDWAWYPAVRWSPGGSFIYSVTHGEPLGLEAPEDSPVFNLSAVSMSGQQFDLVPRAGMFANPVPSPSATLLTDERPYRIAFLQAVEPNNSPFSRYRLGVMDRDGSNVRFVFPPEDQPGLEAGESSLAWSTDGRLLAVVYGGNLWLVDPDTGVSQQLTGDGLSEHPVWGK